MEIEFGGRLFKYSAEDARLFLPSRDIHGVDHIHVFHLPDSFLVNIGGNFWRFVTGVGEDTKARYIFEDVGLNVEIRVSTLHGLGVPILDKFEGKQNLERHGIPVKRLMLAP